MDTNMLYFECAGSRCAGRMYGYPATTTKTGYAIAPGGRKLCYNCAGLYNVNRMILSGSAVMFLDTSHGDPLVVDMMGVVRFKVDRVGRELNTSPGADRMVDVFSFKGPEGGAWKAARYMERGGSAEPGDWRLHCWRTTEPVSVAQVPKSEEYLFPVEYDTIDRRLFDSLAEQGDPN